MKKRLVIVFWDLGIGGVQTRISAIVTRIIKMHPSSIITLLLHRRRPNEVSILAHPNVSLYTFPGEFTIKTPWFKKRIWRFTRVQFPVWLYFHLWKAQPTHILTLLNRLSFFVALYVVVKRAFGNAPAFVINEPVVLSDYLTLHDPHWWRPLTKFSYLIADKIIVAAESVKRDAITHFRVNPNKIQLVRSWVPLMGTTKINDKNKKYDGIYVGRLAPKKGIETALDTAAACKQAGCRYSFIIVGDGLLRYWLIRTIQERHLRSCVSYIGYKKNPGKFIQRARLLLLPSYNEGLPMVILEAYSVGTPVAATPFVGAKEAVEHNKTGIIVERSKYPGAVCRLLGNPKRLERMGEAGRQKAKRDFSMKNLDRFIEAIFTA